MKKIYDNRILYARLMGYTNVECVKAQFTLPEPIQIMIHKRGYIVHYFTVKRDEFESAYNLNVVYIKSSSQNAYLSIPYVVPSELLDIYSEFKTVLNEVVSLKKVKKIFHDRLTDDGYYVDESNGDE